MYNIGMDDNRIIKNAVKKLFEWIKPNLAEKLVEMGEINNKCSEEREFSLTKCVTMTEYPHKIMNVSMIVRIIATEIPLPKIK